ncbi:MAG: hypothetical protein K6G22_13120 [Lachnospiraceae bacterium]|nr:hypothetical protein [Lachnospiraceae bacterium]
MALSGIMTTSLLSASNTMKIARVQQVAKTQMDGHAGVLDAEIKLDSARGADVKKKQEELEETKKKASELEESTMNTLSAASDDLKKAAKDDLEVKRAEKAEEKKKAEKEAEKKKAEKKAAEERIEKIGKAAVSETGEASETDHSVSVEGASLGGSTINVVVDGVTPSTGVTGTIGVSVDEKA